jgi:hypothetical protein
MLKDFFVLLLLYYSVLTCLFIVSWYFALAPALALA